MINSVVKQEDYLILSHNFSIVNAPRDIDETLFILPLSCDSYLTPFKQFIFVDSMYHEKLKSPVYSPCTLL
jgi:hypothetical protein